jgi:hypothetical protein
LRFKWRILVLPFVSSTPRAPVPRNPVASLGLALVHPHLCEKTEDAILFGLTFFNK